MKATNSEMTGNEDHPETMGSPEHIAKSLRILRQARGLTQHDLAEATGLHASYIGALERGEKGMSGLESFKKLADALNVDLRLLVSPPNEVLKRVQPAGGDLGEPVTPDLATARGDGPPDDAHSEFPKVQGLDLSPSKESEEESPRPVQQQDLDEIEGVLQDHLTKRGVNNNLLVGKGVILSPPYKWKIQPGEDAVRVTIEGNEPSPSGATRKTFRCHRVAASRFRGNALFFIRDVGEAKPETKILAPLQDARWKMLRTVPAGDCVTKGEFLDRNRKDDGTIQTDAPRRWRELRNEYGFDVEESQGKYCRGEAKAPVKEPNPRPDMARLKRKYWDAIYEKHEGRCNMCLQEVRYNSDDKGRHGLIDHRIPVPFGGNDEPENLQLFCQTCNNTKTKMYEREPEKYLNDYLVWAYPERYRHSTYLLQLPAPEAQALVNMAEEKGLLPRELANKLLQAAVHQHM